MRLATAPNYSFKGNSHRTDVCPLISGVRPINVKANPIRGFEELLIVLTLGVLLLGWTADFTMAFLSNILPGEIALYREIGNWIVVARSLVSTWPCFFAGIICGLALSRRARFYAALVATPTAAAPLLVNLGLTTGSYFLFAMAFSLAGATVGLRFNPLRRLPAEIITADTSVWLLTARCLVSLLIALTTFAVAAVTHNVVIGQIGPHTLSALSFLSMTLGIAVYMRLRIRPTAPDQDPNYSIKGNMSPYG